MIVAKMTVQEIHNEVFEDANNLQAKVEIFKNDFKKKVLSSTRYPTTKSYTYQTRVKRNTFFIDFTAIKRSSWKKPILNIYSIYSRPEGRYGVTLNLDINMISIYPPHFFKRYRERILKDELISNEGIIRQYFKNDWGFTGSIVNKNFESVYYIFEPDYKTEKLNFAAATSQGYCFGEKQGNVNIIKTIISEDMLFENQKNLFSELKNLFREYNKERYGSLP